MSVETYDFVEAEPVRSAPRQGAGRRPEHNPFESAVAAVAGQSNDEGTPLARATDFTLNAEQGETLKQRTGRIRRFLTKAAKALADSRGLSDPYRIRLVTSEKRDEDGNYVKDEAGRQLYVAKFWDLDAGK